MNAATLLILIAPNVSQMMGGEGIKALQTFEYLKKAHPNTIQITHARNLVHIEKDLKLNDVYFVDDDFISLFLWHSKIFQHGLDSWFSKKAIKLAERIAKKRGLDSGEVIIHQTGPNSPILPRTISKKFQNSFGPINGNIHYPKHFYSRESALGKAKRLLHFPIQKLNAMLFNELSHADKILVAGGERTAASLLAAGCKEENLVHTIDCGIDDALLSLPRVKHGGENLRFVHFGRLVDYKGTDLIIRALAQTSLPVTLDIIGNGPSLPYCQKLVSKLGLSKRVNFIPWRSHENLVDSLSEYRAFVLPSLADSNGIAVQESMALGLPSICLDWGGPQLLIDHQVNGYLIPIDDQSVMLSNMAACMDDLAHNGDKADRFSLCGRQKANTWKWSNLAKDWLVELNAISISGASDLDVLESAAIDEDILLEDSAV